MEENKVFGWRDENDAAEEIYSSIHNKLLEKKPVFLYKNTKGVGDLLQVVVVRALDHQCTRDFGVGLVYIGHTELYPHLPIEFLKTTLLTFLEDKNAKVERKIIEVYKQIIGKIENEQT